MDRWAQRGRYALLVVLTFSALTYLAERAIYHTVIGFGSGLTSLITLFVLLGMGILLWRGYGWLRWPLGAYLLLNGMGTPRGMEEVFGPTLTPLLSLSLLVAHSGAALALWFTPGIRAFLRSQRARQKVPQSTTLSPSS